MPNKPLFIAACTTILACIPLYFLSAQGFQLNTNNLPLMALSLFIVILISSFWAAGAANPSAGNAFSSNYEGPRESGNVKWFNASKGFGFITRDSGDDVFVHFRSIRGDGHRVLHDGQRVEFAVSVGKKGLQAEDVAASN